MRLVPFVGHESLENDQQERAEPAFFGIRRFQIIMLEQAGEELLGEILSVLGCVTRAPHVAVKGIPIRLAEPTESFVSLDRLPGGGQNSTPVRRVKPAVTANGCCIGLRTSPAAVTRAHGNSALKGPANRQWNKLLTVYLWATVCH